MRKLTVIFLLFMGGTSFAQLEKGSTLIGASSNLGYGSYTFKTGPNASLFNINLKTGFFFVNHLAAGLNVSYFSNSQSDGTSSNSTSITELGVFVRYYPGNFFIGLGLNTVSTNASSSGNGFNYSGSTSGTAIPMEFGYAIFVSPHFAVEPSLRYVTANGDGTVTFGGLSTGAKSSIGINIGFTLYVGKRTN